LSEYKLLGWKVEYHYKKELNEKENIPLDWKERLNNLKKPCLMKKKYSEELKRKTSKSGSSFKY
jgi:hypothetical protein